MTSNTPVRGRQERLDLTGIYADGIPHIDINGHQVREIEEYHARLANGRYRQTLLDECALCGSSSYTLIAEKERHGLPLQTVVCSHCGLVRTLDMLDADSLVDFYSTQYRAMYDGVPAADEESALRTLEELWVGVDLHRKLQIAYPELSFGPDSLVCEVGTWAGANLASFDRAGVPVVGCDFDESYLEYGRKRGLNLVRGSIPELREEGVQADLVFLSHVLEHILDPVGFMRSCRDIVVPGGHVYIVVPGLRSLSFGYSEGELLGTLQNVHSFLFELETLRLVMAQAGFTLVKGDEWCSALFRRDDNFDPPPQSSIPVRGPAVLRLIGGLRRSRPFWKFVHRALGGDYYSSVSRIARYGAYALRHPFWGVDFLRQQMVLRQ